MNVLRNWYKSIQKKKLRKELKWRTRQLKTELEVFKKYEHVEQDFATYFHFAESVSEIDSLRQRIRALRGLESELYALDGRNTVEAYTWYRIY